MMLRTLQIEIVYKGLRELRGLNQKKQEKNTGYDWETWTQTHLGNKILSKDTYLEKTCVKPGCGVKADSKHYQNCKVSQQLQKARVPSWGF